MASLGRAGDEFTIRSYAPGDEVAILELFPQAFFVARDPTHWAWKYRRCPWGRLAITTAWAPDGRLACHYAGYPVPWLDAREARAPRPFLGLHIGDTMTATAFRGVGRGPTSLLARTVQRFYDTYCRQRSPADWPASDPHPTADHRLPIAFNFGFITGNHHRFSLRFVGAREVEPVGYRALDLVDGKLPTSPSGPPRLRDRLAFWRHPPRYDVGELDPARDADELDRFVEQVAPAYGVLIRRDAAWLAWRYAACPDVGYRLLRIRVEGRLVGWSVFRQDGDLVTWGDALFDPAHASSARAVVEHLLATSASAPRRLEAWFSARPAWWLAPLDELGLVAQAEPHGITLVYVPFAAGDASGPTLAAAYYTKGDGDLF
jgi:hypothetical protein